MTKPASLKSQYAAPRDGASLPEPLTRVLTAGDQKTLAHLLREGIGENTLRATRSDLAYIEAWSLACDGEPLPWPPTEGLVLRFIAHHLWDPDQRIIDPEHGMPAHVQDALRVSGFLRTAGPHAPATVERRIATWRSLCKWRGVEGQVFTKPEVQKTLRAAIRAARRPRKRKSKRAVGLEIMERLLGHLDHLCVWPVEETREAHALRSRALRDRALLGLAFAAGGRRRSEVAALMHSDLIDLPALPVEDPDWPNGMPSIGLILGRTKTTDVLDDARVFLSGRSAVNLNAWRHHVGKSNGPLFCAINRWGQLGEGQLSPAGVNDILKARLSEIGEDPCDFSAHGIRAGYITSAFKAGIPAPEIMEQTLHRSLDTLTAYFKDEEQRQGRAARLL